MSPVLEHSRVLNASHMYHSTTVAVLKIMIQRQDFGFGCKPDQDETLIINAYLMVS